jgi:tetratricopeptide (TPR) repeat protein
MADGWSVMVQRFGLESAMSRIQQQRATPSPVKRGWSWQFVATSVALFGVTVLVYAQTSSFGYMTVDDPAYVTANRAVQHGLSLQGIVWSFTNVHDSNWIPLTWMSLMLDSSIYGVRPAGYHLTNVVLHALNCVLLFTILALATRSLAKSAFVAALFALHPLHVESVVWIAERKDVLSTLFGMLSLLLYVRYALGATIWNLAGSLLFLIASLLAKQTLVTLPFVYLLLDYWPLGRIKTDAFFGRWPGSRSVSEPSHSEDGTHLGRVSPPSSARERSLGWLVAEKIPFFAVSVVFSVIAARAQSSGGAVRTFQLLPLYAREMNAVSVYVAYLWKAVFPHNLAVYYPYPQAELSATVVTLCAAFLLGISGLAIVSLRRLPFLAVGWFWYLGTLFPMIGLVQIGSQRMADRYTYFPLIGVFLAVAWLIPELVPLRFAGARLLPAAALTLVGLLGMATFEQARLWRNNVTLLQHAKDSTNDHLLAHQFLGSALLDEGRVKESLVELKEAVRLGPWSAPAHYGYGLALQKAGRFNEAVAENRAALAIDSRLAEAHNNLGFLLLKERKFDEAKAHYLRALEIDETLVDAQVNLAFLDLTLRDYRQAIAHAERALALGPQSPTACGLCISLALEGEGRLDEAVSKLQEVVAAAPDDQIARQQLNRLLAIKRRTMHN